MRHQVLVDYLHSLTPKPIWHDDFAAGIFHLAFAYYLLNAEDDVLAIAEKVAETLFSPERPPIHEQVALQYVHGMGWAVSVIHSQATRQQLATSAHIGRTDDDDFREARTRPGPRLVWRKTSPFAHEWTVPFTECYLAPPGEPVSHAFLLGNTLYDYLDHVVRSRMTFCEHHRFDTVIRPIAFAYQLVSGSDSTAYRTLDLVLSETYQAKTPSRDTYVILTYSAASGWLVDNTDFQETAIDYAENARNSGYLALIGHTSDTRFREGRNRPGPPLIWVRTAPWGDGWSVPYAQRYFSPYANET